MKGWIALAGVAVASVALTAAVMAGGMHHGGRGEGIDGFVTGALDDLGATDAQRTRVLAVKDRLAAGFAHLHGEHAAVHAAFLREWGKDTMDTAQLHGLVDAKIEELRGSMHQVVDGVAEIHDTLTPEQRRKLTARVQEMHGQP
ncbi:MAG TPA: Spy/CpxP family protein refolding chaperone [Candidatus Polarisedimenticolaceae bacterium]|nr:Spy/CpxP family protein refolding chaperone [Candidatus Polarisedimenticolaceae bacterium]